MVGWVDTTDQLLPYLAVNIFTASPGLSGIKINDFPKISTHFHFLSVIMSFSLNNDKLLMTYQSCIIHIFDILFSC
jgi:hypothetical protein